MKSKSKDIYNFHLKKTPALLKYFYLSKNPEKYLSQFPPPQKKKKMKYLNNIQH